MSGSVKAHWEVDDGRVTGLLSQGDIGVHAVLDGYMTFQPRFMFHKSPQEVWDANPRFTDDDGLLQLPHGAFLITSPRDGRVVLVDVGAGPSYELPPGYGTVVSQGLLLESMAALGCAPDDVTDVVVSHLHGDHIGWLMADGGSVFGRATVHCHEDEIAHFSAPTSRDADARAVLELLGDKIRAWSGERVRLGALELVVVPGHTPGSTVVMVAEDGSEAVTALVGDVLHSPAEIGADDWNGVGDSDRWGAKLTRRQLLTDLSEMDAVVVAPHFPGMRPGRIRSTGTSHAWEEVPGAAE